MKARIGLFRVIIFLLLPMLVKAQTSLNVPDNTQNTRFYSDVFDIQRPALSLAGFVLVP